MVSTGNHERGATSVAVPGARLAVVDAGAGEPLLFVQTALTADELLPLGSTLALAHHRRLLYHRRGYAGSTPAHGPGAISRDAADAAALLAALDIERAHVVGLSFSGTVGLQLAADHPDLVRTLTLIEPPPLHVPSEPEFRAANDRLLEARRARGPSAALDEFMRMLVGPDWMATSDARLPGSAAQMTRDAATFFDVDLPALLAWEFPPAARARVRCPILYVGGTDSGPWFAEVRDLVRAWFPTADTVVVPGADHNLALTHPAQIAAALATFLRRHPMSPAAIED